MQLEDLYLEALARCAPERLLRPRPELPRNVVAIGKCAGALADAFAGEAIVAGRRGGIASPTTFVAMPAGYREPAVAADVHRGGHPDMTSASFEAGRALLDFVDAHDDITFLISGGGSACVDVPLPPFTEDELIEVNRKLVDSGVPIGAINCVRKHLSAIKGGRLAARVRGRCTTLVLSDVSAGALADVASGPTLADPTTRDEAIAILRRVGAPPDIIGKVTEETPKEVSGDVELIADNTMLVRAAAFGVRRLAAAFNPTILEEQIECDVEEAAAMLAERVAKLRDGELLIAGGEPTVVKHGDGKGGRCLEFAVRFALRCEEKVTALFASSDGVDGNSGVAGVVIDLPAHLDRAKAEAELSRSNSLAVARTLGEMIIIPPSGNNLRDLYILARG